MSAFSVSHSGPDRDPAAKLGRRNRSETVNALQRLLSVAMQQTRQSKIVARFLLALHDPEHFKFKLFDLRVLDRNLFLDCMMALGLAPESLQLLRAQNDQDQPVWVQLATICNLDKTGQPLPGVLSKFQPMV